jgi:stage V sporulation protein G
MISVKEDFMAQEQNTAVISATKVEARAYPIAEPKNSTVAFASVNIDDKFAVKGIRVVNGESGLFVVMPQTRDSKGEWKDVCFPITGELRQQIHDTVLSEYAAALDEMIAQRESAVAKIRETARSLKERPASEKTAEKAAKRTDAEL